MFLKFLSCTNNVLFSSSLSIIDRISLQILICSLSLDRPLAHLFNTFLKSLNLAVNLVALLEA
jgi:hypothetical protein